MSDSSSGSGSRPDQSDSSSGSGSRPDQSDVRVGQGVDVHPFSEDPARPLVLGGVRIPGTLGLDGHSDGDVVLHALVDALLGAAGHGDIGTNFGSEQPEYEGADSQIFLAGALSGVAQAGWQVGNVDLTVVAERPRIGPYRQAIVASLTHLLGVAPAVVNVKATTTDGLGFVGRGDGIACFAAVLLTRRTPK